MPSSYSTNLKIELQATGENSGTWGTITNTNLGTALEQAIVGYGNPSYASDANLTLTYTDTNAAQAARALVLNVTSAVSLTGTRELVVPTIQKQYIVQNNTTGSQSITVKTSAGTGITVPNGRKAHLYVNGTDVIFMDDFVDINGGAIDGTTIGANSAAAGTFTTVGATTGNITTVNATTVDTTNIEVTNLKAKDGTAAGSIADSTGVVTLGSSVLTTTDINGGTIDGTTIGGSSAAAGTFTTLTTSSTVTLNGGTANGVLYLNGSKVATSGSALVFNGTNLGLGVSPSAWTSVDKVLEIARVGNAVYSGGVGETAITANAYFSSGWKYGANGTANYFSAGYGDGTYRWFTAANNTSGAGAAITFGDAKMLLDTSGNLGIGTSSPSAKLEVNGNTILGSDAFGAGNAVTIYNSVGGVGSSITLKNSAASVSGRGVSVQFQSSDTTIGSIECATSGASNAGNLRFLTASSGSNTLKMILDPSGNLGLGVTPTTIVGSTGSNGNGFQTTSLTISSYAGTDQTYFATNAHTTSYLGGWTYRVTAPATRYDQASGSHVWYTAPSGTAGNTITFTQAMTLDASGRLGVGVTSPDSMVEVNSSTAAYARFKVNYNGSALTYLGSFSGIVGSGNATDTMLASTGVLAFGAGGTTERARITSDGNMGLGTTAPTGASGYPALVLNGSNGGWLRWWANGSPVGSAFVNSSEMVVETVTTVPMIFKTNSVERARITNGGDFGIGTTSPSRLFVARGAVSLSTTDPTVSATAGAYADLHLRTWSGAVNSPARITVVDNWMDFVSTYTDGFRWFNYSSDGVLAERARISATGDFFVAKTGQALGTVGHELRADGLALHTASGANPLFINRLTSDGDLVKFYQDTVEEGSISVSGNTVSYNAFAGSHWSQLQDGSKPDILRGTVMESINELCEWPDETNERLPKSKISDTAGSKKVYGVFMAWDNDWTATNDMYITAVGAFICRINGSVTVEEGDLLESNGDGTARVQADDIIRSSTIGKVTSTVKTHQYDDGSYCVPTVLYCG